MPSVSSKCHPNAIQNVIHVIQNVICVIQNVIYVIQWPSKCVPRQIFQHKLTLLNNCWHHQRKHLSLCESRPDPIRYSSIVRLGSLWALPLTLRLWDLDFGLQRPGSSRHGIRIAPISLNQILTWFLGEGWGSGKGVTAVRGAIVFILDLSGLFLTWVNFRRSVLNGFYTFWRPLGLENANR